MSYTNGLHIYKTNVLYRFKNIYIYIYIFCVYFYKELKAVIILI